MLRAFSSRGGNTSYSGVACGDPKLEYKFVCVVRAVARTHNTHKLVEKYYLRRSRNVYGRITLQALKSGEFLAVSGRYSLLVYSTYLS